MNGNAGADQPQSIPGRNFKRTIGSIVGLCLFASAVAFAARNGGNPTELIAKVRASPAWLIALAVVLPALNWCLISLSFLVPMRRYARITVVEMLAVIGAAWLLNYLPLRPGLFGRLAYHKTVNGVSLKDSIFVTLLGMACSAVAVLFTLAVAAMLPSGSPVVHWALCLAAAPALAAAAIPVLQPRGQAWIPTTFLLRYADLLVWIARYWVVFGLAQRPVGLAAATSFAAICQASIVIPFIGNGLGIREWAIGLAAANLPSAIAQAGMSMPDAVAAELLNRAAEVVVAVPVGLAGMAWLARHNLAESKL